MYCTKCGANNSDEAVYCQKCGTSLEDEEETRVAASLQTVGDEDDDEEQIFSIRPTLMFVKIGYGLAVLGAFVLVILLNFLGGLAGIDIPYWLSIPAGLALLLIPAYFHIRQKMLLYTLTDSKVEIDQGLISKTTRNVPLRIIQDVTVSATVTQRLLGFGNVEIENANENDAKIILKNINSPKKYAEILLKQMRKLNK
ncbi:MAG: PH domain-containing protein [Pyrinomonadaceae bacterium]